MNVYEDLAKAFTEMQQTRRYLHMNPELSFQEQQTAAFIAARYDTLDIPYEKNVGGGYGIVARVIGAKPGKVVALRADFDALPIQDQKDVPYHSQVDNVSHACGHDGHTAMLLAVARVLKQHEATLAGEYVLIHQPAEEHPPGGAKDMIEAGCLDGVDVIFATHLWSLFESGHVYVAKGPIMAAASNFDIMITGAGGHGGAPHTSIDAIALCATVISQLQQIVARRLDPLAPAVLSIGAIQAGETYNIIAEQAHIKGTVRAFDTTVRDQIHEEIDRVLKGICFSANADYTFHIIGGYPPVINDDACAAFLYDVAQTIPTVKGQHWVAPMMIGEDFAYYLERIPGVFFLTGAKPTNGEAYPHHHAKFDFDERAMLAGAQTLLSAALNYQQR